MSAAARRVLIRADASTRIGTGPVARCLALAAALCETGVTSVFVMRDLGVDAAKRIREAGHDVRVLPRSSEPFAQLAEAPLHAEWAEVDQHRDAEETVAVAGAMTFAAVIVDSYSFDARWHDLVGTGLAAPVVVIDDLADRDLSAVLVVDHNAHRDHREKYRSLIGQAQLLGGPRYALLDPRYADAPRYDLADGVASIGIFLGGVDAHGLSAPVARGLRQAGFGGVIEVATTSANNALIALREAAVEADFVLLADAPDLAEFFARHDLQLGAAGGAAWERCCIGAPTVAVATATNQLQVLRPLRDLDVVDVVDGEPPTVSAIVAAIQSLAADIDRRRSLTERSRVLVDGQGAIRVAIAVAALDGLGVRPIAFDDAALMHRWRNHPATRAASRGAQEILLEDHERWLSATLASGARTLLMVQAGTRPIGVVGFAREDEQAEVSIYLDPLCFGLGLGSAVLAAAERFLSGQIERDILLTAQTLSHNAASRTLFEASGYRFVGDRFEKLLSHTREEDNVQGW